MRSPTTLAVLLVLSALGMVSQLDAQEWTRFRGPNGTGISNAKTIPVEWTDADLNWRVQLPGIGHSSPVVWGDKIFVMSGKDESAERFVLCVDAANGAILWQNSYRSTVHTKHRKNSYASCTPAVDAERVYVTWSAPEEYVLLALDHSGKELWRRDLGPFEAEHSGGNSPILYKDMVVLPNEQDGDSFLIAVDAATGETRWQLPRRTEKVAYSTPCVFQPPGEKPQLIFVSGAHGISGVDPDTGSLKWELDVLDKRTVSSPIVAAGLVFGTTGSGGGGNYVAALKIGPDGPELAYRIDQAAPYVPTPIEYNGMVFLWSDGGVVTCIDPATGDRIWRERIGGNFSGSPVCVDGRIYCVSEDGVCVVIAAKDTFELLAKNDLGEGSYSTPAISGGRMYLRTFSHLLSVGGK